MTELELIISADLKKYFGLSEDATNVELSDAIQNATSNKRDDVAIEMATQIAELVKMETDKQVTEFTTKLESDYKTIVETLQTKVTELNDKIDSKKDVDVFSETVDFDSKIEAVRQEFGAQLNEIKSKSSTTTVVGDGLVLSKHEAKELPLPSKDFNRIKM